MVDVVVARAGSSARSEAERLDRLVRRTRGHPALGDAVWRDLTAPGADSAHLVAVPAGGGPAVGFASVARSDTFAPQHWSIGVALDPAVDGRAEGMLLDAAVDHVAAHGGGRVVCWLLGVRDGDDAVPESRGFRRERDLLEMRVALPVAERPRWPDGVEVRTFRPGHDEEAWLEVNNRAFENHPEQGAWVADTLHRRTREPWFDPELFLLAFDGEGLAGSNWLKVHPARAGDVAHGEIYVIGVHPRTQGTGLGRALALAGLGLLADRGLSTASLFVDAANTPATALYRSIGFATVRTDRAFDRLVEP
jgi:mycothiol synthase